MGYKIKSMINQTSGLGASYYLKKELNKFTDKISQNLPSDSESTNVVKKQSRAERIAEKKKDKSIGTYINKGGERGYKKSQRKEARAVGREAAKNVDTSFERAELAGTDFNSLLIGTIQNIASGEKASSKKRKIKKAAKKEYQEFQKKGSSSFDGKGLKEGFKGADLPKIDSGIKTGDFFQSTFNTFNPERDKRIKKGPQKPEKTIKNRPEYTIDKKLGDDIMKYGPNPNRTKAKSPAKDQYDVNPPSYIDRTIEKIQGLGLGLPTPRELFGFQMTGDGFNKGMLRKNKYKK